ncbi:MAG: hypothetical protein E2O57_06910 [Gammaproteobacteria bacterium]|nr:MAG: hypothetical protein E2O57_06910 [Gammaproteobacteria bacterium]
MHSCRISFLAPFNVRVRDMGFEAESVGYVTICDGAEVERSWPRIVLDFASERRTDSRPFFCVIESPSS